MRCVHGGILLDLQVRDTLSDFKWQLSRGSAAGRLPSRAHSSLGWLEGEGRGFRTAFASDHAFSYGLPSGHTLVDASRDSSSLGPRTPRMSSRFSRNSTSHSVTSGWQAGPGPGAGGDLPRLGFSSSLPGRGRAEWARVAS